MAVDLDAGGMRGRFPKFAGCGRKKGWTARGRRFGMKGGEDRIKWGGLGRKVVPGRGVGRARGFGPGAKRGFV